MINIIDYTDGIEFLEDAKYLATEFLLSELEEYTPNKNRDEMNSLLEELVNSHGYKKKNEFADIIYYKSYSNELYDHQDKLNKRERITSLMEFDGMYEFYLKLEEEILKRKGLIK